MSIEARTTPMSADVLHQEWLLLQQQAERQEHHALQIKLLAVVLAAIGWIVDEPVLIAALVSLLWLQEAIGRTQQARLVDYLLQLETAIGSGQVMAPMQLNRRWLAARGGVSQLLREYARHGLRPTVLFPYAPLLGLPVLMWWPSLGLG